MLAFNQSGGNRFCKPTVIIAARQECQAINGLRSKGISIAEMLSYSSSAAMDFCDHESAIEAMASAGREEEIASRVEALDPRSTEIQRKLLARHPDLAEAVASLINP